MQGWRRIVRLVALVAGTAAFAACTACGNDGRAPSLLLVVFDTTRMDSVSAYGVVEGTTPYLDSLADEGTLYRQAFAPSPWTLPSHATLFTARGPEQHGVGVGGRMMLGREPETLAEELARAGYETIGFSENPIVGQNTGLARGFETFGGASDAVAARAETGRGVGFDIALGVEGWLRQRDPARPFFVFVNLFDPHDPYRAHEGLLRLPEGISLEEARATRRGDPTRGIAEAAGICSRLPEPRELEILRALYLGEVAAADAKLRRIHELLSAHAPGGLVSVVTADHGEHLGEHRLLGHEFSLHAELLRVPLVVHGLSQTPASIDATVGLRNIAPSLLAWAGLEAPAGFDAKRLPEDPGAPPPQPALQALYADAPLVAPEGWRTDHPDQAGRRRQGCGERDRVFGGIQALLRFPFKLIWYERYPSQLYDLRWDPRELSDISEHHPQRVAELERELEAWQIEVEEASRGPVQPVSAETAEALRALGYAD